MISLIRSEPTPLLQGKVFPEFFWESWLGGQEVCVHHFPAVPTWCQQLSRRALWSVLVLSGEFRGFAGSPLPGMENV